MPRVDLLRSTAIARSPRVKQIEGMFDITPETVSEERWAFDVPIEGKDWLLGLIVGPSGSGKSTVAREMFADRLLMGFDWPDGVAVADAIAPDKPIKQVVEALSSVGFSSPPSWLRPFSVLSTGEQFRVNLARAILDDGDIVAIDEFTSVVDRRVARVASAALSKSVRRNRRKIVAVTCHDDVEDWLQPDWVLRMPGGDFSWRELQRRPAIEIEIRPCSHREWETFRRHHYLSHELARSAKCFLALVDGAPAAFASAMSFPHPRKPGWREHRTVCLPDFQGVGIGNAVSNKVASAFRALGKPYRSTTGNPAMIFARARSPLWRMTRRPSRVNRTGRGTGLSWQSSFTRPTACFEYVGPVDRDAAQVFGLVP